MLKSIILYICSVLAFAAVLLSAILYPDQLPEYCQISMIFVSVGFGYAGYYSYKHAKAATKKTEETTDSEDG